MTYMAKLPKPRAFNHDLVRRGPQRGRLPSLADWRRGLIMTCIIDGFRHSCRSASGPTDWPDTMGGGGPRPGVRRGALQPLIIPLEREAAAATANFAWASSTCAWSSWRLISCTGFMTGRGCREVWPGLALADTLSSGIRGIDILLLLLLCDASSK